MWWNRVQISMKGERSYIYSVNWHGLKVSNLLRDSPQISDYEWLAIHVSHFQPIFSVFRFYYSNISIHGDSDRAICLYVYTN